MQALIAGQITGTEAARVNNELIKKWLDYKMPQTKEDDRNYLYFTGELQILAPKWEAIKAKAAEVQKVEEQKAIVQQATTTTAATTTIFGLSYTELAIAGVAIYLLSRS